MVSHDFFFPCKFVWSAISLLPLTPQNFILLLSWCQWISATPESFSTRSSRWYYGSFYIVSRQALLEGKYPERRNEVVSISKVCKTAREICCKTIITSVR